MEWISVKDKLPENRETVLLLHDLCLRKEYDNIYDAPNQIVGFYIEEINSICLVDLNEYDVYFDMKEFTHWMPLPKPPED